MSVLEKIKNIPGNLKKAKAKREREQERKENAIIKKRDKYLPGIQKVAAKFHAQVEVLDTAAYVSKKINGRVVGVHINYGTPYLTMERKLTTAFTPSATASKIFKGITKGAETIKDVRKDLGKARKEIHDALGGGKNMWEDPNFGKGFG